MSFTKPTTLGIVACPGARVFAREVVAHLKRIYRRRFQRVVSQLAERYGLSEGDVIRRINLDRDLRSSTSSPRSPVDAYRPAKFVTPCRFTRFANGEFKTEILQSVRGMDIYVFQDVENHYPLGFHNTPERYVLSVNDHVMCLLVSIDAALQAGANSVTVVLPSYPYARQHKKRSREGLTAARLGQILENLGVTRIITLDIHSREVENSFNGLRLENLHASYQIIRRLAGIVDLESPEFVVVSPDTGAIDRNKYFAGRLRKPLALLYKERDYSKLSRSATESNITTMRLLGSVEGKTVFMADDLLGTGGTILKAMSQLRDLGASRTICSISLPLFTGEAIEHFDEAHRKGLFYRIIGTNAVYHDASLLDREWYESANVSNLFARIISRLHHNRSLSSLLDNTEIISRLMERAKANGSPTRG